MITEKRLSYGLIACFSFGTLMGLGFSSLFDHKADVGIFLVSAAVLFFYSCKLIWGKEDK